MYRALIACLPLVLASGCASIRQTETVSTSGFGCKESWDESETAVGEEREAVPDPVSSDALPEEVFLPEGWYLQRHGDGWLELVHADGSRLTVRETDTQCSFHLVFDLDGQTCVASGVWPLAADHPPSWIHIRESGHHSQPSIGLVLDWPEAALDSLRNSLTGADRGGICQT